MTKVQRILRWFEDAGVTVTEYAAGIELSYGNDSDGGYEFWIPESVADIYVPQLWDEFNAGQWFERKKKMLAKLKRQYVGPFKFVCNYMPDTAA